MTFGFLAALWALPLAALPAVLHLLSRRRARRLPFSDLTLLRAVDARARPRARLRELLLVAARCGLLACLVLAAAAPSRRGGAARGDGLDLVLLLDQSYSTRAREGGQARFDAARAAGRRLLRALKPGDRVSLSPFDDRPLAPLAWGDARAADAGLASAKPGWRGSDASAALASARALLASSPAGRRRAVVVLGDGAQHSLRGTPPPLDGATAVGLRFPPLANAWIASVGPAPGSSARAPRLEARLGASGAAASTPLDLWVGERRAGSAAAAAPAGGEGRAALALPPPEDPSAPAWTGRVAARPDALDADDAAAYSVAHRPAPRVLVLHSDPAFFRAGRPGWFLRELFGGAQETLAGRDADFLEAGRWAEADLGRYGAVALPDASRPPAGLPAALERFAERGGGVWLVPSARAEGSDLSAYSSWLPARLGPAETPASPRGVRPARDGDATAGWDELELGRVAIARRLRLEPAPGAETWAAASDGAPLLVAGRVGRGRAVVWAAPLDAGSSNLGLKPLFVPWARACLALTASEAAADVSRRVRVGDPIKRTWAAGEAAPDRVSARGPDGRRVTLQVANRAATLPEAALPGLYVFEEPGGRSTAFAAALDVSKGESDLTPAASPPWRPAAPEALETEFQDAVYGRDLSTALLILAALLLLAEMLLSLPSAAALAATPRRWAKLPVAAALALLALGGPLRAQQGDRFIWTQLQLGRDWDPYPDAPAAVSARLAEVTSARVAPQRRAIGLSDPALFSSPFLYLAGSSAPPELGDGELRRLRQFVSGGGFLWIEDSTGGPPGSFDRWVRKALGQVLPDAELKKLSPDHVLYRTFFLLRGPAGRASVQGAAEGADWNGRVAVLYTRDDALGAWARDALGKPLRACAPGGEPQCELARRMTLNVVMYSMTGSYKADAVHQGAILDKLRTAP